MAHSFVSKNSLDWDIGTLPCAEMFSSFALVITYWPIDDSLQVVHFVRADNDLTQLNLDDI
jgi:hypothetical protein